MSFCWTCIKGRIRSPRRTRSRNPTQRSLSKPIRKNRLPNRASGVNPNKPPGATSWTVCEHTKTGFSPLPWTRGFRSRITRLNGTYVLPRLSLRSAVVFARLRVPASMLVFRPSSLPFANKARASLPGCVSYSRPLMLLQRHEVVRGPRAAPGGAWPPGPGPRPGRCAGCCPPGSCPGH